MNGTATTTNSPGLRITTRLIVGLGILTLGLLWTLDNLDVLDARSITDWWKITLLTRSSGISMPCLANTPVRKITRSLVITKFVVNHWMYREISSTALTTMPAMAIQLTTFWKSPSSQIIEAMPTSSDTSIAAPDLAKNHQCGWRSSATVS